MCTCKININFSQVESLYAKILSAHITEVIISLRVTSLIFIFIICRSMHMTDKHFRSLESSWVWYAKISTKKAALGCISDAAEICIAFCYPLGNGKGK